MATIVTLTPAQGTVTRVPGQNTTFTATASSNFLNATYTYQWFKGTTPIPGAVSRSYFIDPLMGDNNSIFNVKLSALNGSTVVDQYVSPGAPSTWTLTVAEDVPPYDRLDSGPETGRERFRRLRHLGYI